MDLILWSHTFQTSERMRHPRIPVPFILRQKREGQGPPLPERLSGWASPATAVFILHPSHFSLLPPLSPLAFCVSPLYSLLPSSSPSSYSLLGDDPDSLVVTEPCDVAAIKEGEKAALKSRGCDGRLV